VLVRRGLAVDDLVDAVFNPHRTLPWSVRTVRAGKEYS
jgi:hypothetical protein